MSAKNQTEFEKLLYSLLEKKPPGTSASRIKELTKIALNSPKVLGGKHRRAESGREQEVCKADEIENVCMQREYKQIAHCVQKFIHRCASEYKLGGLYVLDSITQAAHRQKTENGDVPTWAVEYLDRFEKGLEDLFVNIMQCPERDKEKVKKVLDIWIKRHGIYEDDLLQRIKTRYFSEGDTADGGSTINARDPRLRSGNDGNTLLGANSGATSQAQLNGTSSQALDQSTLLRTLTTLNSLTQGNLKIPSLLTDSISSLQSSSNNIGTGSNAGQGFIGVNGHLAQEGMQGVLPVLQGPLPQQPPSQTHPQIANSAQCHQINGNRS
ncbi:715_t:CDS:2 [Paraglomus occultum]|uniref:715_t:CDS:1 n=1 Tax=Paraglomus occultum TaxID=144539 RepID=A0A9N9FTG0_9GLOM|nr:715_t:CDS:2 [Paraglomus occultum]